MRKNASEETIEVMLKAIGQKSVGMSTLMEERN